MATPTPVLESKPGQIAAKTNRPREPSLPAIREAHLGLAISSDLALEQRQGPHQPQGAAPQVLVTNPAIG